MFFFPQIHHFTYLKWFLASWRNKLNICGSLKWILWFWVVLLSKQSCHFLFQTMTQISCPHTCRVMKCLKFSLREPSYCLVYILQNSLANLFSPRETPKWALKKVKFYNTIVPPTVSSMDFHIWFCHLKLQSRDISFLLYVLIWKEIVHSRKIWLS